MNKFNIVTFLILLFGLSNCGGCEIETKPEPKPIKNNYVVLLDLSDRLLAENQIKRDIEIINGIFKAYKETVKSNYYIKSNDEFKVIIAKQKGMPLNIIQFEDNLRINLESVAFNKKKSKVTEFETSLNSTLNSLYNQVTEGKKYPSQFFGADIWNYFNEDLIENVKDSTNNMLFILTDGYMYFEDYDKTLKMKNRYSNFRFMRKLRKGDWRERFDKYDYGLIPVNRKFPDISVMVLEVNPKEKYINEYDLLIAIWEKWFTEMDIQQIRIIKKKPLSASIEDVDLFIDRHKK